MLIFFITALTIILQKKLTNLVKIIHLILFTNCLMPTFTTLSHRSIENSGSTICADQLIHCSDFLFFETKGRSSAAQLRRKKVIMYKKVSQPSSQNGTRGANHPTWRDWAQTRHTAIDHRCRAWKQSCQQLGLPMAGPPLATSRRVQRNYHHRSSLPSSTHEEQLRLPVANPCLASRPWR